MYALFEAFVYAVVKYPADHINIFTQFVVTQSHIIIVEIDE